MRVLDLFSAAAGGWSLGMHRAGFETVAACEFVDWRRALYAQNNPGVMIYDDVRTLTADRIVSDLGFFPEVVVGSPPCQDISSANTKGAGVDGERSGLFFEAVRIVGEGRPRWVALENSSNLRTRGADRVIAALEAIGYTVWPCVVGADNVGANHERKRAWVIAFDAAQVGHGGWRSRRHGQDGNGSSYPRRFVGVGHNPDEARRQDGQMVAGLRSAQIPDDGRDAGRGDEIALANANGDGRSDRRGRDWLRLDVRVSPSIRRAAEEYETGDAEGNGWGSGRQGRRAEPDAGLSIEARGADAGEMGCGEVDGGDAGDPWPHWNGGFASHLRLHDGLSAELADLRIDLGTPLGTSAASLIVEAFGDAVLPQIPEAIGRAILRVEQAMAAVCGHEVEQLRSAFPHNGD